VVALDTLAESMGRRGLVFVVSDLLFPSEPLLEGVRHLRHRGHEVIVFHLLDPDEIDFPFDDTTRFVGLEGSAELHADPRALRDAYLEQVQRFQRTIEEGCQAARADYVFVNTAVAPGVTLARYLTLRQRRRRLARG
jgi:hypothetical protein